MSQEQIIAQAKAEALREASSMLDGGTAAARMLARMADEYEAHASDADSSATPVDLFEVFDAGWSFFGQLQGHCFDGRDVGRLLGSHYWPPILQGMAETAGIHSGMTKDEAIVKVKQEVARRLRAVAAID